MSKMTWNADDIRWLSPVRDTDDFGNPIHDKFVDGVGPGGVWCIMTPEAHRAFGAGLGLGRGQLYTRQEDGSWLCTDGAE